MTESNRAPVLLNDEQVRQFIANGYIKIDYTVPAEVHATIARSAARTPVAAFVYGGGVDRPLGKLIESCEYGLGFLIQDTAGDVEALAEKVRRGLVALLQETHDFQGGCSLPPVVFLDCFECWPQPREFEVAVS